MKSLAKYTWVLITALSAAGLIACAKAGPSTNNNVGNYYPLPPGLVCTNGICPNGTNKLSFYAQNSMMDQYYGSNPNGGHMTLGQNHRNVLKQAMNVCDRNHSDSGLANCNSWLNGYHDVVIVADTLSSSTVKVIIRSYPYQSNNYGWYASFPSFREFFMGVPYNNYQTYNPMILNMTINPINNSQGFELRGNGPQNSAASGLLFQLQVMNGKLEDLSFDYVLKFNGDDGYPGGGTSSSGRMTRCQTSNCGLPFAI